MGSHYQCSLRGRGLAQQQPRGLRLVCSCSHRHRAGQFPPLPWPARGVAASADHLFTGDHSTDLRGGGDSNRSDAPRKESEHSPPVGTRKPRVPHSRRQPLYTASGSKDLTGQATYSRRLTTRQDSSSKGSINSGWRTPHHASLPRSVQHLSTSRSLRECRHRLWAPQTLYHRNKLDTDVPWLTLPDVASSALTMRPSQLPLNTRRMLGGTQRYGGPRPTPLSQKLHNCWKGSS